VTVSRARTAGATVLLLALALGSTAVLAAQDVDAHASSSLLTVVSGAVVISHGGSEFTAAQEGELIAAGDTIRTEGGAAAEITYFDGSTVRLGAGTDKVVAGLTPPRGDALSRTWRVITRIFAGGSRYDVGTPSSTASVRG
jgi:hypothetical protein